MCDSLAAHQYNDCVRPQTLVLSLFRLGRVPKGSGLMTVIQRTILFCVNCFFRTQWYRRLCVEALQTVLNRTITR